MEACGDCHRHPTQAPPGRIRPDDPTLARFQPLGMMQSRCYTESGGQLSCIQCHDPHARPHSDAPYYENACLECHQGAGKRACPVQPGGGCLPCHMPPVDAGQGIGFTDHWIRVRGPRDAPVFAR
jgi:hypothetical protein